MIILGDSFREIGFVIEEFSVVFMIVGGGLLIVNFELIIDVVVIVVKFGFEYLS